jgi:hypothetical protein
MSWILADEEHRRGSADPFVARTVLQATRIIPLYELGTDNETAIMRVLNNVRRHLHQCDDVSQRIVTEISEGTDTLKAQLANRDPVQPLRMPAVGNLTNDVETFLYHTKLALRELKEIFGPTLGKRFKETTQYTHIADWSEKRFGPDNALTRRLRTNCGWIAKLVDSRNAVEHPERYNLKIPNFHVDGTTIRDPSWSLNGEHPRSLLRDLGILPTNILEFSEILLLYCLRNVKDISPIVIAEIPEEKRDIDAPIRFMTTLEQDFREESQD